MSALPKAGDTVRLVIEGPVTDVHETNGHGTAIAVGGFEYYPDFPGAHIQSVEVIEPPEPQWQPGDVVRDANSRLYVRVGGYKGRRGDHSGYEWLADGQVGNGYHDFNLARPLTPLLVGGKPVTS